MARVSLEMLEFSFYSSRDRHRAPAESENTFQHPLHSAANTGAHCLCIHVLRALRVLAYLILMIRLRHICYQSL